MIPIHYFFILLALLASLMGCTQKAPPGTRISQQSNQSTDSVEDSNLSHQVISRNRDPLIRPSKTVPTTLAVLPEQGDRWVISLDGEDAEMLYQLLEVSEVRPSMGSSPHQAILKTGEHLACVRWIETVEGESQVTHTCTLELMNLDGRMTSQSQVKIAPSAAGKVLTETYRSAFIELDVPQIGKFGRLVLLGNSARKIYESSSVAEEALPDLGSAHQRTGKRGEQVNCVQEWIGDDQNPYYSCRFFFNYHSGSFDKIEILN